MKKYLFYLCLAGIIGCCFGTPYLPTAYQIPVLVFGTFLLGTFFLAGIPMLWRRKAPLRGRGINVEFSKHPIIYAAWLVALFGFGLLMVGSAAIYVVSHVTGVVLVRSLY